MSTIRRIFYRRESISNLPFFSRSELKLLLRHLRMTRPLTSKGFVLERIPLCSLLCVFIELFSSLLRACELFCLQVILAIPGIAFSQFCFLSVHAVENLICKIALSLRLFVILT